MTMWTVPWHIAELEDRITLLEQRIARLRAAYLDVEGDAADAGATEYAINHGRPRDIEAIREKQVAVYRMCLQPGDLGETPEPEGNR